MDLFVVDVDGDGLVGLGDMLCYVVILENIGVVDVNDVCFCDMFGVNMIFVVMMVQISQGIVIMGNGFVDGIVDVDFGMFLVGVQVMVVFDVFIDLLLFVGVVQVVNQGMVFVDMLLDELMDDFDMFGDDDLIMIFVGLMLEFEVIKID